MIPFKITMTQTFDWHCPFTTSITGDVEFCGSTHCTGGCGRPALVFEPPPEGELRVLRAVGSQVALGPVWWALRWSGEVVVLPDEYRTHDLRAWWWL